jgi:O-antigen/teichoic acid export membrane protein
MHNLILVGGNSLINFFINGLAYLIVVRNLNDQDLASYLRIMAVIPVLGVISGSYQQITSHTDVKSVVRKKSAYVWFSIKKSLLFTFVTFSFLLLVNTKLDIANNLGIILVSMYLPLTYIISGLMGILQREKQNVEWQLSTTLESILRLIFVFIFSKSIANEYTMFSALLMSVSIVSLIQLKLIDKSKFLIHVDMTKSITKSTIKLCAFSLFVQSDVILASLFLEERDAFNYIVLSNLIKLIYGILYVYCQMSFSGNERKTERRFRSLNNPDFTIPVIGLILTLASVFFTRQIERIIEIVLNRDFPLNSTLFTILVIGVFMLASSIIQTFESVKEKKAILIKILISSLVFILLSVNLADDPIGYASSFLIAAILYRFLFFIQFKKAAGC